MDSDGQLPLQPARDIALSVGSRNALREITLRGLMALTAPRLFTRDAYIYVATCHTLPAAENITGALDGACIQSFTSQNVHRPRGAYGKTGARSPRSWPRLMQIDSIASEACTRT